MQKTFSKGDRVNLYESAHLAAHANGHAAHTLKNGGNPRAGVILREHPSEPGTFHVQLDDGGEEYVEDTNRMRHLPAK